MTKILLHSLQLTEYRPISRKSRQVPACMTCPGLLPLALAEEVLFSVASVCLFVCPSVCALQAGSLDIQRDKQVFCSWSHLQQKTIELFVSHWFGDIKSHESIIHRLLHYDLCFVHHGQERTLLHTISLKAILKIPSSFHNLSAVEVEGVPRYPCTRQSSATTICRYPSTRESIQGGTWILKSRSPFSCSGLAQGSAGDHDQNLSFQNTTVNPEWSPSYSIKSDCEPGVSHSEPHHVRQQDST